MTKCNNCGKCGECAKENPVTSVPSFQSLVRQELREHDEYMKKQEEKFRQVLAERRVTLSEELGDAVLLLGAVLNCAKETTSPVKLDKTLN